MELLLVQLRLPPCVRHPQDRQRPERVELSEDESRLEVSPGIVVDYDEHDHVVGVEMLYLSKRAPGTEIHRLLFESVPKAS